MNDSIKKSLIECGGIAMTLLAFSGTMVFFINDFYNTPFNVKKKGAYHQETEERNNLERELEANYKHELYIEKVSTNDINHDGLSDINIKFSNDYRANYYLNRGNGRFERAISDFYFNCQTLKGGRNE